MRQKADTLVLVGSLNRAVPHFETANGTGITTLALDETTGKLKRLAETGGMDNPTFLALLPARNMVYATSEVFGEPEGSVGAYRLDCATGTLTPVGARHATRGSLSAYCATDRAGHYLFVVNYAHETPGEMPGRHVVSFAVEPDGKLSPAVSEHSHQGSGPRAERQSVPHAHCVVSAPDNRYALVSDLGTDTVLTYRIDANGRGLSPSHAEPLRLAPGSGPRHLAFHPRRDSVYVVNELNNTLCHAGYSRADGTLTLEQSVACLPGDITPSYAADIAVSNDGRFVYASFRGADCIGVHALAADGSILDSHGLHTSGGRTPRSFTLSPSNRFLLVANQDSDRLVAWRLDPGHGTLVEMTDEIAIGTPMCVKAMR